MNLINKGGDYRGTMNKTKNGLTCQKWSKHSPHKHDYYNQHNIDNNGIADHNYCRNPDNKQGPWCFTTDKTKILDYCKVPVCIKGKIIATN